MDKLEHVGVLVPEEHVSGIQQTRDEMSCNETIQMNMVLVLTDCSHGAITTTMNGPKIGTVQAVVYMNGPK